METVNHLREGDSSMPIRIPIPIPPLLMRLRHCQGHADKAHQENERNLKYHQLISTSVTVYFITIYERTTLNQHQVYLTFISESVTTLSACWLLNCR